MRLHVQFAVVALAGFAAGLAGMRHMEKKRPRAEVLTKERPAPIISSQKDAAASATNSAERIKTLLSLCGKSGGLAERHAIYAALHEFDAGDFLTAAPELPELLLRMSKNADRGFSSDPVSLAGAWMDRWLEVDGAGALRFLAQSDFLAKLDDGYEFRTAWQQWDSGAQAAAYRALASRYPDWTKDHLSALPPGVERNVAICALMGQVSRQDAAAARRLFTGFSDGPDRSAALSGLMRGLATTDLQAGFTLALAEPAGPFRDRLLESAVWERCSDPAAVRACIEQIDDPILRHRLVNSALETAGQDSTENLLPWIIEESKRGPKMTGEEISLWAMCASQSAKGPHVAEAAEWAATLGQDPQRQMFSRVVSRWAREAPEKVRTWLAGNAATLDEGAVEQLRLTLSDMARNESAATRSWADSLPPGRLRENAQFQVALSAGAEGDMASAEAAYESVSMHDPKGALAKQLAQILVGQDGAAAAEWATRRAEGPARESAIAAVASEWATRDPRATADWLGQMPAGHERDVAIREYAGKAIYADPATAAEWVTQVADPRVREQAAETVFWTWASENPGAARAWLRGLEGVDSAWQEKMLRKAR